MDRKRSYENEKYRSRDDDRRSPRRRSSSRSRKSSRNRDDYRHEKRRSSRDRESSRRRSTTKDRESDRRPILHRSDSHRSKSSIESSHDTKHANDELDTSQELPIQPYYVEDLRETQHLKKEEGEIDSSEEEEEPPNSVSNFFNKLAGQALTAKENLHSKDKHTERRSSRNYDQETTRRRRNSSHTEKEDIISQPIKTVSNKHEFNDKPIKTEPDIRQVQNQSEKVDELKRSEAEINAQKMLQLQLLQYQQSNALLAKNITTLNILNQQQHLSGPLNLISPTSSLSKSIHSSPSPSMKTADTFKFSPNYKPSINVKSDANKKTITPTNDIPRPPAVSSLVPEKEKSKHKTKYLDFIKRLEKSASKMTSEQLKLKFKKYQNKFSAEETKRMKLLIQSVEKTEKKKSTSSANVKIESKSVDSLPTVPDLLKQPPVVDESPALPPPPPPPKISPNETLLYDPRKKTPEFPDEYNMMLGTVKEAIAPKQVPQFTPRGLLMKTLSPKKSPKNIDSIYKPSLPQKPSCVDRLSTLSPPPPPPPPLPTLPLPPAPPQFDTNTRIENVEEIKKESKNDVTSNTKEKADARKLSFRDYRKRKGQTSIEDEYMSFMMSINPESENKETANVKPDEQVKVQTEPLKSKPTINKQLTVLKSPSPKPKQPPVQSITIKDPSNNPTKVFHSPKSILVSPKDTAVSPKPLTSLTSTFIDNDAEKLVTSKPISQQPKTTKIKTTIPNEARKHVSFSTPSETSGTAPSKDITPDLKKSNSTTHKASKGFLCGECGNAFPNFVELEIHVNKRHTNIETINKIDVNPHNYIKAVKKPVKIQPKPIVQFTKIKTSKNNNNPDKIKVHYPKKMTDVSSNNHTTLHQKSKHDRIKPKEKKLSATEIQEQFAKIKELRESQQKSHEDRTDTQNNKSPRKTEEKERERMLRIKRLKKKRKKEKERLMKEQLERRNKKIEAKLLLKNENRAKTDDKGVADVKTVTTDDRVVSNVESHIIEDETEDHNKENQDTTEQTSSIVTGKRQSKQTQKKKAFMEALKARQSRRKKLNDFTKKELESKIKVIKTSGMIKAKEVVMKSKKVKREMELLKIQPVQDIEEVKQDDESIQEKTRPEPPKRIPLHKQVESVFKASTNHTKPSGKPTVTTDNKKTNNQKISFENTLLSEDALESIFNRVQSINANKSVDVTSAATTTTSPTSKRSSTSRRSSMSDEEDSSTRIMKKKIIKAERTARNLVRNQRKGKKQVGSQIVQVEQVEPLKVKLHFKMADFVSESTALVISENKPEKQVADVIVDGEETKKANHKKQLTQQRRDYANAMKRSSRGRFQSKPQQERQAQPELQQSLKQQPTKQQAPKQQRQKQQKQQTPKQQQQKQSRPPPRRRRSKYYVYEDELYNEKPLFNETIHVPSICTRSFPLKDILDSNLSIPDGIDFDDKFDYTKCDEEIYLTTDDILSSLMTLSDTCVDQDVVQEMEAARDRKVALTVRTVLDDLVERVCYADDSTDEMVVLNVVEKLVADVEKEMSSQLIEVDLSPECKELSDKEMMTSHIDRLKATDIDKDNFDSPLIESTTLQSCQEMPSSNEKLKKSLDNEVSDIQMMLESVLCAVVEKETNSHLSELPRTNNTKSEGNISIERFVKDLIDGVNESHNQQEKSNLIDDENINKSTEYIKTPDESHLPSTLNKRLSSQTFEGDSIMPSSKLRKLCEVDIDNREQNGETCEAHSKQDNGLRETRSEQNDGLRDIQSERNDDIHETRFEQNEDIRETRSERRNRLSRQNNAFYISKLCIKEEPFDDYTEVDVQVVDENDVISDTFTTDVLTLNTGKPVQKEEKIPEPKTPVNEVVLRKLYSCDRNLNGDGLLAENGVDSPAVSSPYSSDINSMSYSSSQASDSRNVFFECPECGLCFKSDRSLHFHKMNEHLPVEKDLSCQFCRQTLKSKVQLSRHLAFKHGVHNRGETSNKCSICGLTFLRRFYLKSHMKGHHKSARTHRCNHCGILFDRQILLYKHKAQIHLK